MLEQPNMTKFNVNMRKHRKHFIFWHGDIRIRLMAKEVLLSDKQTVPTVWAIAKSTMPSIVLDGSFSSSMCLPATPIVTDLV